MGGDHKQSVVKITEILEYLPLFSDLTPAELLLIEPLCSVIEGSAGTAIIQEGGVIDNLYVLLSGEAVIKKRRADGRQVTVGTVGKNEVLGEVSFMKRPPASATVEAKSPYRVLVLSQRQLHTVLRQDIALGCKVYRKFARVLCDRISKLTDQVAENLPL